MQFDARSLGALSLLCCFCVFTAVHADGIATLRAHAGEHSRTDAPVSVAVPAAINPHRPLFAELLVVYQQIHRLICPLQLAQRFTGLGGRQQVDLAAHHGGRECHRKTIAITAQIDGVGVARKTLRKRFDVSQKFGHADKATRAPGERLRTVTMAKKRNQVTRA